MVNVAFLSFAIVLLLCPTGGFTAELLLTLLNDAADKVSSRLTSIIIEIDKTFSLSRVLFV